MYSREECGEGQRIRAYLLGPALGFGRASTRNNVAKSRSMPANFKGLFCDDFDIDKTKEAV
jgi:hypothetical protein